MKGVTVGSTETAALTIKGHACKLAIAPKVNEASQALLSDDYAANEPQWQEEHKCSGPYALIAFGPTDEYTADTGQISQEADGSITTYDCFPIAKALLLGVGTEVLPELLTALTCNFFTPGRHFRVRPVDSVTYGITPEGITVHELRITVSAQAFASPRCNSRSCACRSGRNSRSSAGPQCEGCPLFQARHVRR